MITSLYTHSTCLLVQPIHFPYELLQHTTGIPWHVKLCVGSFLRRAITDSLLKASLHFLWLITVTVNQHFAKLLLTLSTVSLASIQTNIQKMIRKWNQEAQWQKQYRSEAWGRHGRVCEGDKRRKKNVARQYGREQIIIYNFIKIKISL